MVDIFRYQLFYPVIQAVAENNCVRVQMINRTTLPQHPSFSSGSGLSRSTQVGWTGLVNAGRVRGPVPETLCLASNNSLMLPYEYRHNILALLFPTGLNWVRLVFTFWTQRQWMISIYILVQRGGAEASVVCITMRTQAPLCSPISRCHQNQAAKASTRQIMIRGKATNGIQSI